MDQKGSISRFIELSREGDQQGIATLYDRFQSQLISWANRKLDSAKCRAFDAEDVAIEAFHAFCLGIENGSFPEIENRQAAGSQISQEGIIHICIGTANKLYVNVRSHEMSENTGLRCHPLHHTIGIFKGTGLVEKLLTDLRVV